MAATSCSIAEIPAAINEQIKRSLIFTALDSGNFDYMGSLGALLQLKPFLTMYADKLGTERVRMRDETLD